MTDAVAPTSTAALEQAREQTEARRESLQAELARTERMLEWIERMEAKLAKAREQARNVNLKLGEGIERVRKPKLSADLAEAVFGVAARMLLASQFADTSSANRAHYYSEGGALPDEGVYVADNNQTLLAGAASDLARFALEADVLPEAMRKDVEERLRKRAEAEAEAKAEQEREQLACELRVLHELDAAGGAEKPVDRNTLLDACDKDKGTSQPHHMPFHHRDVDAALERLAANRQISRVDVDGTGLDFKLNPSGAARLEAPAKKGKAS